MPADELEKKIFGMQLSEVAQKIFNLAIPLNSQYHDESLEKDLNLDDDQFKNFCNRISNETSHIIKGVPTQVLLEEITEWRKVYHTH